MKKLLSFLVIAFTLSIVNAQEAPFSAPFKEKPSQTSTEKHLNLKGLDPAAVKNKLNEINNPQSKKRTSVNNRLQNSIAPVYMQKKSLASGNARVVLSAGNIWNDGTGYQMLLDADANTYGTIIPTTGALTNGGDVSASIYAEFEYKIPTNADGALNTANIVFDTSIGIDIPSGTYDFCITNPTPGDRMWIVGGDYARADDYVFEAGKVYIFTVTGNSTTGDLVTLEIQNPDAPSAINLTATPDTNGALECTLSWTNPSTSFAGGELTDLTSVTIKRGNIIHTINNPVVNGNETWVDNTLSSGEHTYTIFASNEAGDGVSTSVNISVGIDGAVTSMPLPINGANLTATEQVRATVKNLGVPSIVDLPITLEVNGTIIATETIAGPIVSLEEYTYTFTATADLSAAQGHTVTVYIDLDNDMDNGNDTIHKQVINYGNIAVMSDTPQTITDCNIPFMDDGVYDLYTPGIEEEQTITFLPETQGDRVTVEFTSFSVFEGFSFFSLEPDVLYVYEGSTANENNKIAELTGDLSDNLPLTFTSYATDGALTFVFEKNGYFFSDEGWEANIRCVTPLEKDASITSIISPVRGGSTEASVKVNLKNYGGTAITSMDVAYVLNNGTPVVQSFTGNIIPGANVDFTFNTTIDLSAYETYNLKVYTLLSGDLNPNNDTVSTSFNYKENVKLYGYRTYGEGVTNPRGVISFNSNSPESVTVESTYTDGDYTASAGEYFNESLYLCTYEQSSNTAKNLVTLNANDWTKTSSVGITNYPNDMAYDYSSNKMYAVFFNEDENSDLFTVNLETGASTRIASLAKYVTSLACNLDGTLLGLTYDGDLCSINKTTGAFSNIKSTGLAPGYYYQSMAFDHNSGRLFLTYLTASTTVTGGLVEIEPSTGKATNLGNIGNLSQVVMLYTPYPDDIGFNPVNTNANIKFYPNPVKDKVTIEDANNSTAKIYDISGKLLIEKKIQNNKTTIDVGQLPAGIYFIDLQNKDFKTTKKLIKQ